MSLVFGPLDGVSLAGGARAFPARAMTTSEALASVPAGQRMSPAHLEHVQRELHALVGVRARHWSYLPGQRQIGEDTAALAARALREALSRSGLEAEHIDALFVATSTPHRFTSTVASHVGGLLGIQGACLDLRAGCSAGIYGLLQAAQYVQAGARAAALVGADTFSAVLPPEHRLSVCVMGDGASAALVVPGTGCLHALYYDSDGAHRALVHTPGPMPPTSEALAQGAYRLAGDPEGFNAQILPRYTQSIQRVLAHVGMSAADVDLLLPHQTSAPMLTELGASVGLPAQKVWTEGVAQHANIGAAGWISALVEAQRQGRVGPGSTVLCASVGGGMSWGAALWTL